MRSKPPQTANERRLGTPALDCGWLVLAALLGGLSVARGETVERILAVVDGRPVLLSEVDFVASLKGLDQRAALESLIDQRLMLREARRLPQATVTAAEEQAAHASLVLKFGKPSVSTEDLKRLARREAAILKYIEFRFRPQVRVSDEQLRRAWEAEYSGVDAPPPLEAVSESLRRRLAAADLDQRVEAWVRELRTSAEIRYNAARP
jgi:hypothetical protein